MHAVMLGIAPGLAIVDLGHELPPHDVAAGAALLSRAVPYLDGFVVVGVVDPGVGTDRRRVALRAGGVRFVGPDNGLLAPAADALGGPVRVVELTDERYWLPSGPSGSFDGRDVFGPVAAHLAGGATLEEVGTPVDPGSLVRLDLPVAHAAAGRLEATVSWVDRFGNIELAATGADLAGLTGLNGRVTVRLGDRVSGARRVASFGDLAPGELGVMADSSGHAAVVLDRHSAAAFLGAGVGDRIQLTVS